VEHRSQWNPCKSCQTVRSPARHPKNQSAAKNFQQLDDCAFFYL